MGRHDSPTDRDDYNNYPDQSIPARRALVVVASTRAAEGIYEDESGKTLATWLESRGFTTPEPVIVADADIPHYFAQLFGDMGSLPQVILTTGGTGLSDDDITVDELAPYLTKQLPGIAMQFWQTSLRATPLAVCSRALAGVVGHTFVMALPGSVAACRDGIKVLDPIIDSLMGMLEGTHVH